MKASKTTGSMRRRSLRLQSLPPWTIDDQSSTTLSNLLTLNTPKTNTQATQTDPIFMGLALEDTDYVPESPEINRRYKEIVSPARCFDKVYIEYCD